MYGLVDCDNFFVSCERVFNPSLQGRPVIVLSNNDGCVVALSNEAKKLGLKRGNPYFQISGLCELNNVAVFSGNHRLYGDMSSRVMAVLSSVVPDIEIYSIDEAFISLDGWDTGQLCDAGHDIVRKIRRCVGIPVSLGIASTKTLAKVAAKFAKKYPGYHSCCFIGDDEARRKALSLTPIGEVWGVGRKLVVHLERMGIQTALQLADCEQRIVESSFALPMQRTWRELNGESCIDLEQSGTAKKQLCCSRSFSNMLTSIEDLGQAIAAFSTSVSRRLREQGLAAVSLSVFIHTNAHRQDLDQYYNSGYIRLEEAASDTMAITDAAMQCLRNIYRKGYRYKKAGVIINEAVPASAVQHSLFRNPADREKRRRLMAVIDSVNSTLLTRDALHVAAYQPVDDLVRKEHRSRLYTTRMEDIISVS